MVIFKTNLNNRSFVKSVYLFQTSISSVIFGLNAPYKAKMNNS